MKRDNFYQKHLLYYYQMFRKVLSKSYSKKQKQLISINPNTPNFLSVTDGCGFIGSTFINYWLLKHIQMIKLLIIFQETYLTSASNRMTHEDSKYVTK